MKKILVIVLSLAVSMVCTAQGKNKKEKVKADFYGVDFSTVNVVGAAEPAETFLVVFEKINGLLISEAGKYDVGKFLNMEITSTQVEQANKQIEKLQGVNFKDRTTKTTVQEVIQAYPATDGNILLLIANELNKKTNKGTFTAVVFNGQSKQLLLEKTFSGNARGFGLRNFWAGSLYDGLKRVK